MSEAILTAPQTTLLILLGASQWPRWPDLGDSTAFANSAKRVRRYFLSPQKFHLPPENLLDLFDSNASADAIDEEISHFLTTRMAEMAARNQVVTDLVVYYIGHAGLIEGSSDYYLTIRCARKSHPGASALRIDTLARTIKTSANHLRCLIILDCCYAASAFSAFQRQGREEESIPEQAWDVFKGPQQASATGTPYPRAGISLLCSSSRTKPSLYDTESTEFSRVLLHILENSLANGQSNMSLRFVTRLVREFLDTADSKAPRPEVHSPDQRHGDVADFPFFPNFRTLHMQSQNAEKTGPVRWSQEKRPLTPPPLVRASRHPWRYLKTLVISFCFVFLLGGAGAMWFLLGTTAAHVTQRPAASRDVQFGFDAAHTNWNPDERVLNRTNVARLRQLWSLTLAGTYSSPTVAGGMIYIGAGDGKLYAFDATCRSNCHPLWDFATGNSIDSSAAVANGMVYIGSGDGSLYALDATCRHDCQALWSYQIGKKIDSSPTVANGMVYIGSSDGAFSAFDASCRHACQPLWSFPTGGSVNSSAAVAGGMVYITSQDDNLYAFDASCRQKCQPLWSFPLLLGKVSGGGFDSSPAVANGMVYVGSWDGTFSAFDASCRYACQPLWSFLTGSLIEASPAVAYGIVYIASFDHKVYAFDASCRSGCQPLWTFTTGDVIGSSPVVANGVLYVNSWDGNLYAFNASCRQRCRPLSAFPLIKESNSSTPVVANGMIYIGSNGGAFFGLGLAG